MRRIHPDIQVIYTSGQAGQEDCTQFGVPGALLLTKPYTSGELAVAITEAGLKLNIRTLID
ncbi:hypothetical protein KXR53_34510 [Inquilinus limosus]|uniref:hypothetical protein n=1 Tax=Inquilinus limosus TaxID=171674 RepID=UPI003F166571